MEAALRDHEDCNTWLEQDDASDDGHHIDVDVVLSVSNDASQVVQAPSNERLCHNEDEPIAELLRSM